MPGFGYAGEILEVDLSDGYIKRTASADYTDAFLGGKGLATGLYWEKVPPTAGVFDPENCLIFASGPVAGFSGFAGSRWNVCGKSPAAKMDMFSYSNLGGKWGTALKYSGYDALAIRGIAHKPAYILIDNGAVIIKDASRLWGKSTFDTVESLKADLGKGISILTIGPAGEKLVTFANVISDDIASGSGGLGAIMGSKMLKAIAVAGRKKPVAADRERLGNAAARVMHMKKDSVTRDRPWTVPGLTRQHICFGCGIGCDRLKYRGENGRTFKALCQASDFYMGMARSYYGECRREHLWAASLCDGYGLDSVVLQPIIELLMACHREGLLSDEESGLPLSRIGSIEFIEALTEKIANRDGFGDILAMGTIKTAKSIGREAEAMLSDFIATRAGETKDYDPRIIMTTSLLYATEPRRPIQQLHEISRVLVRWLSWVNGEKIAIFTSDNLRRLAEIYWGGAVAADFSTTEGKALAAKKIQDRAYVKESLVLCDRTWADFSSGKIRDNRLESAIVSAITGKDLDETELCRIGERIFNLQRAILLREGWEGRKDDRILDYFHEKPVRKGEVFFNEEGLVPGKDGQVISRIGKILNREEFDDMKSEYYKLRGWDVGSGLPKKAGLKELGLSEVADDLCARGLLK
ncbi:MAG: hypothetical protein JW882_12470 [Deltaproteobacteria bacterium]|nr:hypothetical protein [Deltaproteobacteria bacterium]